MKLMTRARLIIEAVLPLVYGNPKVAERVAYDHLQALVDVVDPCVRDLKAEIVKLEKVLAYTYRPTENEVMSWYECCNQISACGGNPPIDSDHWAEIAVSHWECRSA